MYKFCNVYAGWDAERRRVDRERAPPLPCTDWSPTRAGRQPDSLRVQLKRYFRLYAAARPPSAFNDPDTGTYFTVSIQWFVPEIHQLETIVILALFRETDTRSSLRFPFRHKAQFQFVGF